VLTALPAALATSILLPVIEVAPVPPYKIGIVLMLLRLPVESIRIAPPVLMLLEALMSPDTSSLCAGDAVLIPKKPLLLKRATSALFVWNANEPVPRFISVNCPLDPDDFRILAP
jgi:hypothetical protein